MNQDKPNLEHNPNDTRYNETHDNEDHNNYPPTGFNSEVPSSSNRKRPTKAFLSFLIAFLVVGGLTLVAFLLGSKNSEPAIDQEKIAEAWNQNKTQESSGVFFTMKLDPVSESDSTSLIFDQNGKVRAKDSCFESESNYIVKEDGSIAVENLANSEIKVLDEDNCVDVSPNDLFFASSINYSNEAQDWIAYDAAAKPIGDPLVEDTEFLSAEKNIEIMVKKA